MKNISPKEAYELIKNKKTIILDTRSQEEFEEGHIDGSKLIDLTNPLFVEQVSSLDKNKEYTLYCHTGGRSSYVSNMMIQLGFKKVNNILGGLVSWENQGLPIKK